jgi:putative pyruvate formate lyase activating enzyme
MLQPAYIQLLQNGELKRRVEEAWQGLSHCRCCAWECGSNRLAGKTGVCRTGALASVSSYGPHLGEEQPLRGWRGSGTIFFSGCNLRCQYCQNSDISQTQAGDDLQTADLAAIMLELQSLGCHNINLVTPSHVAPQILASLLIAAQAGLRLPLVYNTGGYDSIESLRLLDGVVDIYMPDMKYSSPQAAQHYSKARSYPEVNQAAVREMYRQVGDLQIDESGLATHGLLVRHLVLPNGLAGSGPIMRFLAQEISKDTYLNIMDQYRPSYNARLFPKLNRPATRNEVDEAVELALQAGLHRLDKG